MWWERSNSSTIHGYIHLIFSVLTSSKKTHHELNIIISFMASQWSGDTVPHYPPYIIRIAILLWFSISGGFAVDNLFMCLCICLWCLLCSQCFLFALQIKIGQNNSCSVKYSRYMLLSPYIRILILVSNCIYGYLPTVVSISRQGKINPWNYN